MHTLSLPPTDRDELPDTDTPTPASASASASGSPRPSDTPLKIHPCNTALRDKLRELRDAPGSIWSNQTLGNKLGYSSAVISQYLSDDGNKYKSCGPLELKVEDFLTALAERRKSGIETAPSRIAEEINLAFDYTRKMGQIAVIIAESGEGKSRGIELIRHENPTTIYVNVTEWNNSKSGIKSAIWQACPHDGYDRTLPQFVWLATKMKATDGIGRPFIIDNAHKLGREALALVITFLDETKCPGALLGLNILVERFGDDLTSQTTSRVGVHWPVKVRPKTDKKLLSHMIKSICKDINGELDDLVDLCQQVADHHGAFRAVEHRLKGAAELRRSDAAVDAAGKPSDSWTDAFRLAHKRSLHPCQLT